MEIDNKKPVIVVENVTKFFPLRGKNKRKRNESVFSFFYKDLIEKRKDRQIKVLDNVNFEVFPGEIVGLIGSNGAGKSTLLRIITGITQATSGTIRIDGSFGELFSLNSGFNMELSGRQNIFLYAAIKGIVKEQIESLEESIIEFCELGEFIDQPVKTYSSGMRSRLGFSLIFNTLPEITIIDEALSAGDASFRKKTDKKFFDMFENESSTAIMVSHNLGFIRKFCTRVIWLEKGVIQMDGDPDEVIKFYLDYNKVNNKKKTPKRLVDG